MFALGILLLTNLDSKLGRVSLKVVFNAIEDALVGELGKTYKGGPAEIPEREAIHKNMDSSAPADVAQNWARAQAH